MTIFTLHFRWTICISLDHAVEFLKTTLAFAVELSLFEITK